MRSERSSLHADALPRLALLLLACGAISASAGPAAAWFPFLSLAQNAENPGYAVHPSGVNSFHYNPSLADCEGPDVSLSYDAYLAGFDGFTANTRFSLPDRGAMGISAFVYRSPAFDDWDLNSYFDPVKTGTLAPWFLDATVAWAPAFARRPVTPGFAIRLVHQDIVVSSASAVVFDAGMNGLLPASIRFGAAVRNLGFGLFRMTDGYLPLELTAGLLRSFRPGGKRLYLDILLNNRYVLSSRDEWLIGLHARLVSGRAEFAGLLDLRLSSPGSAQDGFSPGLTAGVLAPGRGPGFGLKAVYRLSLPVSGGLFHNFSLVYSSH